MSKIVLLPLLIALAMLFCIPHVAAFGAGDFWSLIVISNLLTRMYAYPRSLSPCSDISSQTTPTRCTNLTWCPTSSDVIRSLFAPCHPANDRTFLCDFIMSSTFFLTCEI